MNENLLNALNEAIQANTFNLSAVEAIKTMRDENVGLKKEVDNLEKRNQELHAENKVGHEKAEAVRVQQYEVNARSVAVTDREKLMAKIEVAAAKDNATATAYKECFGLVFRNQVISKSIMGQAAMPGENGCSPVLVNTIGSESEIAN